MYIISTAQIQCATSIFILWIHHTQQQLFLFNTNGKCSFLLRPRVETLNNISCCVLQAYSFCVISFFLWKRMFRVNYVSFHIFIYNIWGEEDKWHAWTEIFYFLKCQHNHYQNVLQDMIDFIWLKTYLISQQQYYAKESFIKMSYFVLFL